MRYVIIGNSAAGIGAVEGIRQTDGAGEITVVSTEPHHTYSRPLISYLLLGKTDETRMKYRPADFYEKNNCRTLLGRRAVSLDPKAKTVTLDDGASLPYDRLFVGAGSSPFVPPMEGLDRVKNKFTFMTLDDSRALDRALTPDARVLIVGAGLIGLKCAEGIRRKVGAVTVIDLAPRILSSVLDEAGAALVQKHIEAQGITFILSQSVATFAPNEAALKDGRKVPFDVLVLAVGVRPNTGLVSEAGGKVGRGVAVDDHMRTSLPGVYAAGDCAESLDISSGTDKVMALLPNAYMGGECAGVNMAGGDMAYDSAFPMNAVGFFGLRVITAGAYEGDYYLAESGENVYKKLFYEGDRLKGYILIGNVDKAGIYTGLIREKTALSGLYFDLICQNPCLLAFSKEDRGVKLGGAKA